MENNYFKKIVCLIMLTFTLVLTNSVRAEQALCWLEVETTARISSRRMPFLGWLILKNGLPASHVVVERSVERIREVVYTDEYGNTSQYTENYYVTPVAYICDRLKTEQEIIQQRISSGLLRGFFLRPSHIMVRQGIFEGCDINEGSKKVTPLNQQYILRELEPFDPIPTWHIAEGSNGLLKVIRITGKTPGAAL